MENSDFLIFYSFFWIHFSPKRFFRWIERSRRWDGKGMKMFPKRIRRQTSFGSNKLTFAKREKKTQKIEKRSYTNDVTHVRKFFESHGSPFTMFCCQNIIIIYSVNVRKYYPWIEVKKNPFCLNKCLTSAVNV